MMGDAPGEIRCPHESMGDEADDVAYGSVSRESTMTGLDLNKKTDTHTRKEQAISRR